MATPFDLALCLLTLAVSAAAVLGRQGFVAIVFFITYGLLLALAWLRLDAVDVALAEAAIGAGLTGILLLVAHAQLRRLPPPDTPRPSAALRGLGALVALCVTAVLILAIVSLPASPGLRDAVMDQLPRAGSDNPVTAVLLNFRGWDTLLETLVLLSALLGVWTLARDEHWPGRAGRAHRTRPDGVLAQFGRILPPIALIIGVYLVWIGGYQPGGAFQGGTVLAAAWIVAVMAGLLPAPHVDDRGLRAALLGGPFVFASLALAGVFAESFLYYPPAWAKYLIMTLEAALAVAIAATLAMLVFGTPEHRDR
jgi:multisubunit Na+/H+ antiporter MnhB subunit